MIKDLGPYIKSRRKNIGLTQRQIAYKVYVTVTTVSRWETGTSQPDWQSFVLLCDILGMKVEDFTGKEN